MNSGLPNRIVSVLTAEEVEDLTSKANGKAPKTLADEHNNKGTPCPNGCGRLITGAFDKTCKPCQKEEDERIKASRKAFKEEAEAKEAAEIEQEEREEAEHGKLRYPELAFPIDEVLYPGSKLRELVQHACMGGDGKLWVLDPSLVTEAMLTLASALPYEDEMVEIRINRYSVLLAMSGGGKGASGRRVAETLGLVFEQDYDRYSPSGHVQMIYKLGDRYEGKKPNQIRIAGPRRMAWITEELSGCLKMAASDGSKVMQQLLDFYDNNIFLHTDSKTGRVCKMDCRLSWETNLAVGYGKIEERKFTDAFRDASNDGLIRRLDLAFSEQQVDRRDLEGWKPPQAEATEFEYEGMPATRLHDTAAKQIARHVVKGYDPGVFEKYRAIDLGTLAYPGWQDGLKKNMVHIALVNLHTNITMKDYEAAVALTKLQGAIRKVFLASQADDDKQARFNERVIRALRKADQLLAKKGRKPKDRVIYVPRIAQRHEWSLAGKYMPLDRTIRELENNGVLIMGVKPEADGKEIKDWEHVRLHHPRVGCWCGEEHPKE